MAINVADNFSYKGKKAFDARTSYATLALMKAVVDADINEGCMAYCAETDKYYKFLSTNTVDADTGKWREYSSGGGGTTYTAGDGISIDENDEISTDNMPSSDMEEIIDPLPGVMSRRFKYSTAEQIIGEWIDGKPLYQKTLTDFSQTYSQNTEYNISVGSNIDKIMVQSGCIDIGNGNALLPLNCIIGGNASSSIYCFPSIVNHTATLKLKALGWNFLGYVITIQYTKTTD